MCTVQKHQYTSHQNANTYIYNTDNTGSTAFTCGHTFANNNRCQYFNAYKSNVTQYIYFEYMGIEVLIWFELPHGESVSHYDA